MVTLGRETLGACGAIFAFFIEFGVSFSSDLRFRDDDEEMNFDLDFAAFAIASS
jgi:hypothetical protein